MHRLSPFRFWLIILVVFIGLCWLLKPILPPFLAGLAIAYFLDPLVDRIARRGLPRWLGALIVLTGFILIAAAMIMLLLPLFRGQLFALLNSVPVYMAAIRAHYLPMAEDWLARFSPEDVATIRDAAGQSVGEAATMISSTMRGLVTRGIAFIDALALTFIAPIVAFHAMRDWGKLRQIVDDFIPRHSYQAIRDLMNEIHETLTGFVRGQALVCLSLGVIYSLGLYATKLPYGPTLGLLSGFFSFIPYVGTLFGVITSVILAIVDFNGDGLRIGSVVAVFAIGHFFEAYILTPRFVGHRVGLHPVWILFALITGVKLLGFVGVLIAVPTAAVIGVLIRFFVRLYKDGSLYKGM